MENRIRITNSYGYDSDRWRAMCRIVNIRFFPEEYSLTFKAVYSNSNKLKGFEIRRPGSTSVIGYIDTVNYVLYFIDRRKVNPKTINLRSERHKEKNTAAVRYIGGGMFEWGEQINVFDALLRIADCWERSTNEKFNTHDLISVGVDSFGDIYFCMRGNFTYRILSESCFVEKFNEWKGYVRL